MDQVTEVETSRRDGVLTITLNRPDSLNAMNQALHGGLRAALEEARDPAIRAVVLTGAGRGFCAGQDVEELQHATAGLADRLRETYNRNILAIRALEKPVLAAINGPAAGAGLSLALACDVRIASDAATLVPGYLGIGLASGSGASWLLTRLIGAGRAFEWLTTGRRLTAADAHDWGLVSEVVPTQELEERIAEVAQLYADLPTRAVWEVKRLLDRSESATLEEQLESEVRAQVELVDTADFREGVDAFVEKREPAFTGAATEPFHPIGLTVDDDLRRWRLTVFFRLLLAVPHLILATWWLELAVLVSIAGWFVALFTGRIPKGMHEWIARCLRYYVHVQAYVYLIADPYPGFRGWYGTYPVDLLVASRAPQARWKTLLRLILVLPAYALATVLGTVLEVVAVIGWFASLALGRMPRGMRDLMAYCLRYQVQTYAYLLLLTSRYPSLASGGGFQFEEA